MDESAWRHEIVDVKCNNVYSFIDLLIRNNHVVFLSVIMSPSQLNSCILACWFCPKAHELKQQCQTFSWPWVSEGIGVVLSIFCKEPYFPEYSQFRNPALSLHIQHTSFQTWATKVELLFNLKNMLTLPLLWSSLWHCSEHRAPCCDPKFHTCGYGEYKFLKSKYFTPPSYTYN